MAVVVLGGLLSAVVFNMLVVPALFLRYGLETPHGRPRGPGHVGATLVLEPRR